METDIEPGVSNSVEGRDAKRRRRSIINRSTNVHEDSGIDPNKVLFSCDEESQLTASEIEWKQSYIESLKKQHRMWHTALLDSKYKLKEAKKTINKPVFGESLFSKEEAELIKDTEEICIKLGNHLDMLIEATEINKELESTLHETKNKILMYNKEKCADVKFNIYKSTIENELNDQVNSLEGYEVDDDDSISYHTNKDA